ncbi:filamin-binding LIM protein 1 isoform X2 [Festucalex cinctus]
MTSADSSRKVSSVFITLATPHQTKAKQQGGNKKGWVHAGPSQRSSGSHSSATEELPQRPSGSESRAAVQSGHNKGMWENDTRDIAGSTDVFSPPPLASPSPPLPPPPSPPAELPSYPPEPLPTPSPPPAQKPVSRAPTSPQPPPPNKEVVKRAPSSGKNANKQPNGVHEDNPSESRGLCGLCQKPILFTEPALSALERIYHKGCFNCRTCRCPLAGKTFYDKGEVPECETCYENSLDICWSCGEKIRVQRIRALQRVYHPTCFTCVTCKQPLENFVQADTGEVYCHLDYGRKFAKTCNACNQLIMDNDGTIPGHIESDGRTFHKDCYRCEVCHFKFSLEKEDCYSLDGKRLCLPCSQKYSATTN